MSRVLFATTKLKQQLTILEQEKQSIQTELNNAQEKIRDLEKQEFCFIRAFPASLCVFWGLFSLILWPFYWLRPGWMWEVFFGSFFWKIPNNLINGVKGY